MDKDRIKGKIKQVEGTLQDAAGDFTPDVRDDIAGKTKKVVGKVQEEFGKAKDAVRQARRK